MQRNLARRLGVLLSILGLAMAISGCGSKEPPVSEITAPANWSRFSGGERIAFSASVKDDSGSEFEDARITWDFGDGSTSSEAAPVHAYDTGGSYTVRMQAENPPGERKWVSAATTVVFINKAPLAIAEVDGIRTPLLKEGVAPLAVRFDGTGSTDPDGTIETYAWDFGDGEAARGASASHTYLQPGVYVAELATTDNEGAEAESQPALILVMETQDIQSAEGGFVMLSPVASTEHAFEDARLAIEFEIKTDETVVGGMLGIVERYVSLIFSVTNVSNESLEILWDESLMLTPEGDFSRPIHRGILERSMFGTLVLSPLTVVQDPRQPQPPTVLEPGEQLTDYAVPFESIRRPFYGPGTQGPEYELSDMDLEEGGVFGLFLAIAVQEEPTWYSFVFQFKE